MGTAIGRLKKGELLIKGEVNERLPAVTKGLTAHFPFDGTCFDSVGGHNPVQGTEQNKDLIELCELDWRDPNNWRILHGSGNIYWDDHENALVINGYLWMCLKNFIQIDTSKKWYIEAVMKKEGANGNMYLGDIAYDKNHSTSTIAQHPGAYEYFGAIAVKVPALWTKYKNHTIGGQPRTGTSDIRHEHDKFDPDTMYIQPLIIGNYTSGVIGTDKLYIKDLKFYYTDDDTSNATITNKGVSVEENTTNLVGNPDGKIVTNYNYDTSWDSALHEDAISVSHWSSGYNSWVSSPEIGYHAQWILGGIDGVNDPCMFFRDENNRFGLGHKLLCIWQGLGTPASLGWSIGTQITISWWQKVNVGGKGACVGIYHYKLAQGSMGFEECIQRKTSNIIGEWERKSFTYTITNNWDLTKSCSIYVYGHYGAYGCLWVDNVQVETKKFATSFVNGSRAEGDLKFDNILPKNKGTVVVDVTFHEDNTVNGYQGADQYCFGNQLGWNAANSWWFHDTDWWWIRDRDNVRHSTYLAHPMVREERTHLAFVYDDSDGTMDIYKNGVLDSNGTKKPGLIGKLGDLGVNWTHSGHAAGTTYKMCQTIHSLSFYDRTLTADEIKKLAGSKFHLTKEGNVMNSEIVEKPHGLPSDALYFPLSCEGKDQYQYITPSEEKNVVYEDGAVWLGNSTTNIITNTNLDIGWGKGYCAGIRWNDIDPPPRINSPVVSFIDNNADQAGYWYSYGDYAPQEPGKVYTVSLYVKTNDSNFRINHYTADNSEVGRYWSETIRVPNDGKWHRVVWNSFTNPSNSQSNSLSFRFLFGNEQGESQRTWLCAPQMEQGHYATPFVNGTRPQSKLNYRGIDLTSNHWQEFSMIYTAKYMESGLYRLSGAWQRFYIGATNSNGLRFSWVENGSQRHVNTKTGIVPINEWITLGFSIKNNQFIDIYKNDNKEVNWVGNFQLNSADMDFELNSISPTFPSYPINGYVKDMIIIPRAISENEMKAIYNTQMRAYKNKLQIQHKISENMDSGLNANSTVGSFPVLTTSDIPVTFRESAGKLQYSSDGQQWNNV